MLPAAPLRNAGRTGTVRRSVVVLLAALALLATPCSAQIVLEGHVVDDSTGRPIAGAHVLLMDRYGTTVGFQRTDSTGRFNFERPQNGRYRLYARAVGYQPSLETLLWMMEDRHFAGLEVRLAPHATLLAPVEVVAMSPPRTSTVLRDMEFRKSHGLGIQITRAEIDARHPLRISDMLEQTPGVHFSREGSGTVRRVIHIGPLPGPGGGDCPVQIFVDGMLATRADPGGDVTVDDLVEPQDVEEIEIFKGLASVPAEFLNPDARCGVIAIWTRR